MEERRWEELIFDCLISIFSKLGLEDLAIGVPLVCKSWQKASLDPQCWQILNFKEINFTNKSKFITRFKQEYKILNFSFASFMKLSLSKSQGLAVQIYVPSLLSYLQQDQIFASMECPRLKVLTLPSLLYHAEEHIIRLIPRWKDLEVLEIRRMPIYFLNLIEEIGANCPKFIGLRMSGIFTERDSKAIVKCVPKLRSLILRGSIVKRDDLLLILYGCKELDEVDVSRCMGFDADDHVLKKASSGIKKFACEGSKMPN